MKISLAIRIGLSVVLLCMTNTAESKVQVADAHSLPADPIPCPGQCYCAKRLLICSGANITDILNVTIDFQRLEHLEYSNMTLDALPEELKFMSDCKTLNLSGNHIEHFDNDSMLNLWNLEELILSSNSIYNISMIHPDTLLYNNKYIKLLNLSNNPLTNLEGHAHSIFRSDSLEVLDLSHCQIESVVGSRVLSELKKLTYLNLSNNPLVRFDGVASNTLRILNLKGGQLRYLSQSSMRNLKNLEVLDVSFNEELYIMVGIQTTSLETIDAGTCSVRSPNIHGMSGLKSAFFNGNRIRRLDAYQFINNSNLEFLDLSQNIVETVDPQAFRGLTSLVSLDLSSNMIKSIAWEPLTVAMPSLQELRLSHNMISHVSPLVSKTLRRLDFRHCWITSVPGGAFAQLDGLAELVLSNNPLRTVLPDSFNSSRLTALDLSFCRLSHLSALEFAHTPNLTDLNLAGNRLVTIKNGTFAKCPKLRSVYLDDNPWRCDCYSLNFAYMAFLANKTTRLALLDRPPKCLTPDNVTGMPWHVACRNALSYTRDNRKNFSMAIGVILILCVSGLTAIFMAVHENIKTRRAMRRRRQLDEYGNPSRGGLGTGADEYFDEYAAAAESARKLSQLPSYDEAIMLPRPPEMRRAKRHSCTQTDDDEPADADSHLRPAAATANRHHHHHHHHHHHRRSAAADGSGGSGSSGSSGGSGGGGGGGGGGGAGDALSGLDIYDVSGRGADDWFLSPKPRPPSLPPPGLRVTHL